MLRNRDWSGATVGLCLGLIGLLATRLGWLRFELDVFSAFTIQFLILICASILGITFPRYKSLAASLFFVIGLVAYGTWPMLPVRLDVAAPQGSARLRVGTYNAELGVGGETQIIASLKQLNADVIVLTEYDASLPKLSAALATLYPFVVSCEDTSWCDVTIASKTPITKVARVITNGGPSTAVARMDAAYGNVLIVGVHATRFPQAELQFQQLRTLATWLVPERGNMIVAGDFNASSQSRLLQDFTRSLDLQVASYLPTYPSWLGVPQLAIDHFFIRKEIGVLGPEAGSDAAGSDHIPVARSFSVPLQSN